MLDEPCWMVPLVLLVGDLANVPAWFEKPYSRPNAKPCKCALANSTELLMWLDVN